MLLYEYSTSGPFSHMDFNSSIENHETEGEQTSNVQSATPLVVSSISNPTSFSMGTNHNIAYGSSDSSLLTTYLQNLPAVLSSFSANSTDKVLPIDFEPSEYDILCGRGKGRYNRSGNRTFRAFVAKYVNEYESCVTKIDKSRLLEKIVDEVKKQHHGSNTESIRFVKYDGKVKRWYEVCNDSAREKVGHTMRVAVAASKGKDIDDSDSSIDNEKKKAKRPASSPTGRESQSKAAKKKYHSHQDQVESQQVQQQQGDLQQSFPPVVFDSDMFERQSSIFRKLLEK